MKKTCKLRKIIREYLIEVIPDDRLFYGFNNGNNLWKVNYKLTRSGFGDAADDITLEINIWDTDSLHADELTDIIEELLNYRNQNAYGCYPTFYLDSKRDVDDPDKRIERRMLTYNIRNYGGNDG